MNVHEFVQKWSQSSLTERSAAHQHFLDLCEVVGHPKPTDVDLTGDSFTFEKGAAKYGGGSGWADVWKRDFFGWEYKRRHADLAAAYDQLLRYREALENPPLLVACDMDRIVVHTNFTGRPAVVHTIPLRELAKPENLEIVRAVFHDPEKLKPGVTREGITQEAASRIAGIAQTMRARGLDSHEVAQFLDRVVFALFAEDVNLLPDKIFSRLLKNSDDKPEVFARLVRELFHSMAHGGFWGVEVIRHFNGNLFTSGPVLTPTREELKEIRKAAKLDWSAIDPSIFGTLFERGMDPDKRSQLGAHYTSREDIETLVEPVVMQPLRREWAEVRRVVENLLATGKKDPMDKDRAKVPAEGLQGGVLRKARLESDLILRRFWERLGRVHVLDPACGSGNFLYVTLQKLKDLEKEVILWAMSQGFPAFIPHVGPWQLHGIEINPYAFELAQMSVWIGYLQWIRHNGFGEPEDPVLRPMDTFECKDAILDLSDPENPREPEWPKVDFIVGNPPFLGNRVQWSELGRPYVESLHHLYGIRLAGQPDLCCYWFEKARAKIAEGSCGRAGLLATQAIRGGTNRAVLESVKKSGDIFFAESDRDWVLDKARTSVHVSMVGFDDGSEVERILDGKRVLFINSDLTAFADVTQAKVLAENSGISFQGAIKRGPFDLKEREAVVLLAGSGNPNGRPNSDVMLPYVNGLDVTRRSQRVWIIDFGGLSLEGSSLYVAPFARVEKLVKPGRVKVTQEEGRRLWWQHWRTRPEMNRKILSVGRFIATARVAKHRLFTWLTPPSYADCQIVAFAAEDDTSFGLLHSRLHEIWSLAKGTQVRERESGFRYTSTTCFETFPFPHPTPDQQSAIAAAAKELDDLRNRWLNPPEWTREEILEFPGSADGPWARYIHDPDERGIGTVRYPRVVPRDEDAAEKLKERTLTKLYNQRPTWLDLAHRRLDEAVFAAYGWDPGISDGEILERLLALNLERAAGTGG